MSIQARMHHLLSGLILLSLLLTPMQSLAQPSFAPAPTVGQAVSSSDSASATGLFRTRVTVRTPADWARLEKLGVVVLAADEGRKTEDEGHSSFVLGHSSVVVLADEAQLEALARLRFEPESRRGEETGNGIQGTRINPIVAKLPSAVKARSSFRACITANEVQSTYENS